MHPLVLVQQPALTVELLFVTGAITLLPAHQCSVLRLPVWIGSDLLATAYGVSWCFDLSGRVPRQQPCSDAWLWICCGASP